MVTTDEADGRTLQWFNIGSPMPDEWPQQRTLKGEFRRRLDAPGHGEFRSGDSSVELSAGTIECG
jgi:hypothetical protein